MYELPQTPVRRLHTISALPPGAPAHAENLWQLSQHGSGVSVEDEATALAQLDHPEFAVLWEHDADLPDRFMVEGVNPRFHVAIHQVVETQLLQNDPPAARAAVAHLLEQGVDRHTALHLVMDRLLKEIHTAVKGNLPDNAGYAAYLDRLSRVRVGSGPVHSKLGRNDPCPCGSGQKYKRCCGGADAPPAISPEKVRMVLGDGFDRPVAELAMLPQNHPVLYLHNLGAVAQALEEVGAERAADEAYRRLDAAAHDADRIT